MLQAKSLTILGFTRRCFSLTCCLSKKGKGVQEPKPRKLHNRRKTLIPFDKRLPVTAKHVKPSIEGGSVQAQLEVARHDVPAIGYKRQHKGFRVVSEMKAEFIVPDLKDFKLKPYVSYSAPEINQTALTSRDLFNACYSQTVIDGFHAKKSEDEVIELLNVKTVEKTK